MDKWINKLWSLHTMKYDLPIKRHEVLIYVMTLMNLEHFIKNERNQTQNITYCITQFIWHPE